MMPFNLDMLPECVEEVIGEGVSTVHLDNLGWIGSLQDISCYDGYWLHVPTEDCWLIYEGTEICSPEGYYLNQGNNLISYPCLESSDISSAIPDEVEDYFYSIIGQGISATQLPDLGWVGSIDELEPNKGYWFNIEHEDVFFNLTFDFICPEDAPVRDIEEDVVTISDEFTVSQSTSQAFYYVTSVEIDNEPIVEKEDILLAYNNNVLVGSRVYDGAYTDIPVMGFNEGELFTPTFKVYKYSTGEIIDLNGGNIPEFEDNAIYMISSLSNTIIPDKYILFPAYPNPFNPITSIEYALPNDSFVSLSVYDINGRLVDQLVNTYKVLGHHKISWNAGKYATGLYFIKLIAGEYQNTQKVILVK